MELELALVLVSILVLVSDLLILELGFHYSVRSIFLLSYRPGAVAGVSAQAAIYPLEVAKTRLALAETGEYRGIADCLRRAFTQESILGLYRGVLMSLKFYYISFRYTLFLFFPDVIICSVTCSFCRPPTRAHRDYPVCWRGLGSLLVAERHLRQEEETPAFVPLAARYGSFSIALFFSC
jgi:hypothetical protein